MTKTELLNRRARNGEERLLLGRVLDRLELAQKRSVPAHTQFLSPGEQAVAKDLLPFVSGTKAGAGGVLVSHNIVTCLDPDLPASLSPAAYALLRQQNSARLFGRPQGSPAQLPDKL